MEVAGRSRGPVMGGAPRACNLCLEAPLFVAILGAGFCSCTLDLWQSACSSTLTTLHGGERIGSGEDISTHSHTNTHAHHTHTRTHTCAPAQAWLSVVHARLREQQLAERCEATSTLLLLYEVVGVRCSAPRAHELAVALSGAALVWPGREGAGGVALVAEQLVRPRGGGSDASCLSCARLLRVTCA